MSINISYLEVPMFDEVTFCNERFGKHSSKLNNEEFEVLYNAIKSSDKVLKENMYLTAQPLYKSTTIEWDKLHLLVSSDYRQYTPFEYNNATKKSENWNNENQNILILDVDDGLTINQAMQKFSKYKYFICTTKSHQVEKKGVKCDRFRIILPIINCPKGDEYFEYMRILEDMFDFVDKQVNTKTGAFLGCSNCQYWYNDGILFDMDILKPMKITKPIHNQTETYQKQVNTNFDDKDIEEVKKRLNREIVADVVKSLGFNVDRKFMFKYRNERSASTGINDSDNPLIKDFGGELETDVFGFVQEVKGCNFLESVNYVKSFV